MFRMRASAILFVGLCGCNALIGIGDMSSHGCEDNGDCAGTGSEPACGSGAQCATEYQVKGTDSMGLAVQSQPHVDHVLRWVQNGTRLRVVCQTAHGDLVHDPGVTQDPPFTTWDQLDDGTWVYDWYMTTPPHAEGGYSPGIPPCPGG